MSIYGSDQHTSDESCIAKGYSVKIKDKWKVFSVRSCFSNELTVLEATKLFDDLVELDGSIAIDDYFQAHPELVAWEPFEYMEGREFVEHINSLARYAQTVEGWDE